MINAGIVGATGYAGQQLFWLLRNHPNVEIKFLSSHNYANLSFSDTYANYRKFIHDICIESSVVEDHLKDIDVLFIALPHGKAFDLVKKALSLNIKVIDLGADYRIKNYKEYFSWYGVEHKNPDILQQAVYGLTEINRKKIKDAGLIANPGCYPTASILALYPLLKHGLIDTSSIIIDAKSGISGAGRSANIDTLFTECSGSIKAYGVTTHRHTPEIEQELSCLSGHSIVLSFTPHLVPMNRGILATCYGSLIKSIEESELYEIYKSEYENEFFIRVKNSIPETRWVRNSNLCDIGIRVDKRTGRVIIVSAIDNLIKGAAGQAVQNMNVMFGIEEITGIDMLPMAP